MHIIYIYIIYIYIIYIIYIYIIYIYIIYIYINDWYLRDKVESLASGQMLMEDVQDAKFISWVAALGSIKVTERPVEGLHSRINTILRANPNTSMAFISNELRFSDFVRIIASDPQATWSEVFS